MTNAPRGPRSPVGARDELYESRHELSPERAELSEIAYEQTVLTAPILVNIVYLTKK